MKKPAQTTFRRVRRRLPQLTILLLALIVSLAPVSLTTAQATVPVVVTILRVKTTEDIDLLDGADFYPVVSINGAAFGGEIQAFEDDDDIEPGWSFPADVPTGSSVSIQIQIWDSDGGLNFDDDHVDVSPSDDNIDLTLDTNTCNISGDVSGICWLTIESSGNSDDNATIWFKIGVGDEPQMADVVVTILEVNQLGENGCCIDEDADFYGVVTIAGHEFEGPEESDDDHIFPNWPFSERVPLSVGSIGVEIAIYDRDGALRGDDDHNVLTTGHGFDVDLNVDVLLCADNDSAAVTGDVSGGCGVTLHSVGEDNDDDDWSEIFFRIDVQFPPTADNFRIRCLHDNLWPDPGESVTLTADLLNDAMDPLPASPGLTIEFWVDSTAGPVDTNTGVNMATHTFTPPGGAATFTYGCRATDGTQIVWTGWRTVQIGQPPVGKAVPVMYTGVQTFRLDIVFFPDSADFSMSNYDQFIDAVEEVLWLDMFMVDNYLENSNRFNFWLAQDFGTSQDDGDCEPDVPFDAYVFTYVFADGLGVVHSDAHGDCASHQSGIFAVEANPATSGADDLFVGSHETGHASFGLADEYDDGDTFYFEPEPLPNLYEELGDCNADAPSLGNASCRQIQNEDGDEVWYVSDPSGDDLMEDSGDHNANPADRRRIEWIFNLCRSGKC